MVHVKGTRQGQQSYAFYLSEIWSHLCVYANFAYNEQTTVVLFAHGVAASVHCNKQQSQVLFYPGWGSFVSL